MAMALPVSRLTRAALRQPLLPYLLRSRSARGAATWTDDAQRNHRTGFLEQVRTELLPELGALRDGIGGGRRVAPSRAGDERNRDFKRTLVRECTQTLREQVVSRYLADGTQLESQPPQLVVLDGVKGVGKSAVVEQTAAFARMKGYVVLYIPDPESWTDGGGFFAAAADGERDPVLEGLSAVRFYDRPLQMHRVFKLMLEIHREDLAGMECRPEFSTELTSQCESVLDIVELGDQLLEDIDTNWRNNPTLAGEVFRRFVKELCACETRPVAIIIDNFERFAGLTCMINERQERLHANCIRAIAEHFGRDAIEKTAAGMANGFVLLATDPSYAFQNWRWSRVRSGLEHPLSEQILRDPSGKEWVADFKSRVMDASAERQLYINVPALSASELKTLCTTFVQGGLRRLVDDANPSAETERLVALAGGRADVMQKIATSR